ncbi:MAG TPA: ribosome-associated translation inhibitor RaiA [Phaeodactylibacter sp.]|nr:ribosome-associated translation inhibitor RaiA [Phaeodactylibacter sp.]
MKIMTDSIHFKADQKLLDFIDEKVGKLEKFYDRIVDAEVKLKLENTGQVRDKIVELKVHVPRETLFASESHKTFEVAVEQAVKQMLRQLKKYKEKLRS